jgi:DNA polymerase III alpha subunit (gram-positive type)
MRTLVFDTETTGLPKHPSAKDAVQPRIIEFAGQIVDVDGNELAELELLINPHQPLEEIITKITGLTDGDLEQEPTFAEVADQLNEFFAQADCLLSHNLPFDSTLVELELTRNNIQDWHWPKFNVCTVQEHVPRWGYRPKLTQLYEFYTGEKLQQTHRAMDDVRALALVAQRSGVLM